MRRNRLTDHGDEPHLEDDLSARYYIAWDAQNFYFGAEVWDNVNDLDDPDPADKRWYFKDAICWFMEGPRDRANERFGQGDNAFCFVADPQRTPQNAWWRHGAPSQSYIEEPIPEAACDYVVRMDPWGRSAADFILEARVDMHATFCPERPPLAAAASGRRIQHGNRPHRPGWRRVWRPLHDLRQWR